MNTGGRISAARSGSRNQGLTCALVPRVGTRDATMFRARILPAPLGLALSLCLISSAEARGWRWHFYGLHIYGYSHRSVDAARPTSVANVVETARASTGGGAFGALVDRLVRGCLQQAADFQSWPFEAITQIVSPDDAQRSGLEALRASVTAAAERLSADCPRDEPAPPWARLKAAEQAIDTATSSFAAVEPPLRAFYAALDDEQKARLLRDLTLSRPQAREGDRAAERGASGATRGRGANFWAGICESLTAALRGWPIREIERGVRLSEPQRVAFYELVTSSLRAADALAGACPAETALTPPGRLKIMQARLFAVRAATAADSARAHALLRDAGPGAASTVCGDALRYGDAPAPQYELAQSRRRDRRRWPFLNGRARFLSGRRPILERRLERRAELSAVVDVPLLDEAVFHKQIADGAEIQLDRQAAAAVALALPISLQLSRIPSAPWRERYPIIRAPMWCLISCCPHTDRSRARQ